MNDKPQYHHPSGNCSINPFSSNFCRNCAFETAARKCTNAEWCSDRQCLVWEQNIKPLTGSASQELRDDVSADGSEHLVDWEWVDVENGQKQERGTRKRNVTLVPRIEDAKETGGGKNSANVGMKGTELLGERNIESVKENTPDSRPNVNRGPPKRTDPQRRK
ncbi:hypothetical protein GLAREA_02575 [Glarea lozoyensis ATCC 20868]|uniref:Uncharacterized protein n=1 Tax=Glarea lozoyensis (strain ATCC 20868 / MF5171) TaxID=1116229 RepID=S3CJG6_GLAL2|nr:uncharacterized protein GLAREA_02575 [Glarea lozoyensis ATCC 20868]EPE26662.1 hypothetical protein GLAREA_02575 [Glarea lozoyensis ATCC 20868]